ncbi:MAG: glycosyltransferase family 1 protein [Steroidobacteraceae bacterium]
MRILIVTDAWHPQTNGVVTTLTATATILRAEGHDVEVLGTEGFRTFGCPSYPEIRLAVMPDKEVRRRLAHFRPEAVHIATEGPLGLCARAWCLENNFPFTTSYHTQYPEYVSRRYPIPLSVGYAYMRWFHRPAERTLVATNTVRQQLQDRGLRNLRLWTRGVDTDRFQPCPTRPPMGKSPVLLYAGRVAVEKNLEAFLEASVEGTKMIVGDGPALSDLRRRYSNAIFTGYKFGDELVKRMAAADVFVFPSRTDTFGLVMLEAMACGVPVAAYPGGAPEDVVAHRYSGVLDENLETAIRGALKIDREHCRKHALQFSWMRAAKQFLAALAPKRASAAVALTRCLTLDSASQG